MYLWNLDSRVMCTLNIQHKTIEHCKSPKYTKLNVIKYNEAHGQCLIQLIYHQVIRYKMKTKERYVIILLEI